MNIEANQITSHYSILEDVTLPQEWKLIEIKKVAAISTGGSAPQGHNYFNGSNPFVRVQHLDINSDIVRRWDLITDEAVQNFKLKLFPKGTIVFPKSGASIRLEKKAILPIDSFLVSHLCAVLPYSDKVEPRFLLYSLKTIKFSQHKESGYPTLNTSEIKSTKIPLPEQKTIAHILSTVQRAKEATEQVIRATKELKKSLMRYLFTYGAVPVEEAENVKLKETEIGMVPEDWEVTTLGGNCHFTTGKLNSNQAVSYGRYPFFTCSKTTFRIDRYSFDCEAILLSGNNAKGEYSVKHYKGKFDAYQRTYVITIKDTSLLEYRFLLHALDINLENLKLKSIGTSTKFLTLKTLQSFQIPLPSLDEQKQIAEILSAADRKIEAEENRKKALDELFKTLLNNLMTGKLRVNTIEVKES